MKITVELIPEKHVDNGGGGAWSSSWKIIATTLMPGGVEFKAGQDIGYSPTGDTIKRSVGEVIYALFLALDKNA